MSYLIPMLLFSLSMSFSPGPVNLLAMTSGLNYGFANSVKFVFGATAGFTILLLMVGIGLGRVNDNFPQITQLLRYAGCAYLFYIGYNILNATGKLEYAESHSMAPSFVQGWLMQWLNPKAWVACLAGCSAFNVYASQHLLFQFLIIYFLVCFIGIASWAILGQQIQRWINSERSRLIYNRVTAGTLFMLATMLLLN